MNNPNRDESLKPVEVGDGIKARTIGRNKSGCPWKKSTSEKSSMRNKSLVSKSWAKKVEERNRMKALKERITALRDERI